MNISKLTTMMDQMKLMQKQQQAERKNIEKQSQAPKQKKESTQMDELRAQRIARRIAGGKSASADDRKFLEENYPQKLAKAKAADSIRRSAEARIRTAKSEKEVQNAIRSVSSTGVMSSKADADFADLCMEAARVLRQRRRSDRSSDGEHPGKNTQQGDKVDLKAELENAQMAQAALDIKA